MNDYAYGRNIAYSPYVPVCINGEWASRRMVVPQVIIVDTSTEFPPMPEIKKFLIFNSHLEGRMLVGIVHEYDDPEFQNGVLVRFGQHMEDFTYICYEDHENAFEEPTAYDFLDLDSIEMIDRNPGRTIYVPVARNKNAVGR